MDTGPRLVLRMHSIAREKIPINAQSCKRTRVEEELVKRQSFDEVSM